MKKNSRSRYLSLLIIPLIVIGLLVGCNDDDPEPIPTTVAYVSLYHASPDAPGIDILMENNRINFYPLRYADYTGYLNFYSGERQMRVSPYDAANVVLDTMLTFEEGEAYSLFYVNEFSKINTLLVEDEFVSPEEGNSAIRVIHLSPDAPNINVVRIAGQDSMAIAENGTYLQATDFEIVPSGIQSFEVLSPDSDQVLLSIPDVNLLSNRVYTIIARGFNSPPAGNTNNLTADIVVNS
jgi:hypothetical protein